MDHLQTTRLAVAGVVIALSIVLLGLTGHGLAFKPDPVSTMTLSASGSSSTPYTIAYLPYYLQQGGYIIILVAGCGGIIDGLLVIFLALQRTPLTFKVRLRNPLLFPTPLAVPPALETRTLERQLTHDSDTEIQLPCLRHRSRAPRRNPHRNRDCGADILVHTML
jgi:hypothetical protein